MPTPEATTAKITASAERHSWNIWAYVRDNAHSLDSDRACKMIEAALNDAKSEALAAVESLAKTMAELRAANRRLIESNKTLLAKAAKQ